MELSGVPVALSLAGVMELSAGVPLPDTGHMLAHARDATTETKATAVNIFLKAISFGTK